MEDKLERSWTKKKRNYLLSSALLLVCALWFLVSHIKNIRQIKPSELTKVDGLVLRIDPKYEGIRGYRALEFEFVGYDKLFAISSFDYDCIESKDILNNIHANDSVSIWVKSSDLHRLNVDSWAFPKNQFHLIEHRDKVYGDLNCRNKQWEGDSILGIFLCLFVSLCLFLVSRLKDPPVLFGLKIEFEYVIAALVLILLLFFIKFF
jgi:hypothetical protein